MLQVERPPTLPRPTLLTIKCAKTDSKIPDNETKTDDRLTLNVLSLFMTNESHIPTRHDLRRVILTKLRNSLTLSTAQGPAANQGEGQATNTTTDS